MIDVEQHALRAFEQDPPAKLQRRIEIAPYRTRKGQHETGDFAEVLEQPVAINRRFVEAGAQRIVMRAKAVQLRPELAEMG